MTANELRTMFIDYFKTKGHTQIPSSSLIPENDASVLFTTAGMHPLVPYLLGEKHPAGQRLCNCQKCIRTGDIDEVGDASHLTFFEMLGNWSLGDYFKEESIRMSYEFLTKHLSIPHEKIAVTLFKGNKNIPKDVEGYEVWKSLGFGDDKIFFYGEHENWWGPAGLTGPCGPDTEIFYDSGQEKCGPDCGPACRCGKYVEIWNNVFMAYNKTADGRYEPLAQKNVDTGMGLERITCVVNHKKSVYDTELFTKIIEKIEEVTGKRYEGNEKMFRIIADHTRASVFILGDDKAVTPSNVDQGYILRRFIRRVCRYLRQLGVDKNVIQEIACVVVDEYKGIYCELEKNREFVIREIIKEEETFNKTISSGIKIANKYIEEARVRGTLEGAMAFKLYDTFGFPLELTMEIANEQNVKVDVEGFNQKYVEHQEKSRAGAEQKFKGGLADHTEETTRLHTATHLLQAALRKVFGETIYQKGSNITAERLRFDFPLERKMTEEEIKEVESMVNEVIEKELEITCEEMTVDEAKEKGALGVFEAKYGEKVKVYTIGDFSKEICGGPHVKNTKELQAFKIIKEESSSSGIRRIKAVVGIQ